MPLESVQPSGNQSFSPESIEGALKGGNISKGILADIATGKTKHRRTDHTGLV